MKIASYVAGTLLLVVSVYFGVVNRDRIAQWFGQVFTSRNTLAA